MGYRGYGGGGGLPGEDGRTVLNGTGAPSPETGAEGDFYIDTAAEAIYGPKTSGAWGSPTSLVGPAGADGQDGQNGAPGAPGADGADGQDGAPGAPGAAGADGKTVRSGSGAPAGGLGVDGDFYIDTTAHAVYGPKAGGAWGSPVSLIGPEGPQGPAGADGQDGADGAPGAPGANGADGADGKTVRNGSGAPAGGLGVDGDFYIDTAASAIYGPKTSGAWGSPTPLVGPQGQQGPAGADGQDGADGAPGAPGADGDDGVGVPAGGAEGQVLAKKTATDYDTEWVDQTGGTGGLCHEGDGSYSIICGQTAQTLDTDGDYSVIGGGQSNQFTLLADYSVIGGGSSQYGSAAYATIGGGFLNQAKAAYCVIGGGSENIVASGSYATIAGGYSGYVWGEGSAIGGGKSNYISGTYGVIAGGYYNVSDSGSSYCSILGGQYNSISGSTEGAAILGGIRNEIAYGAAGGLAAGRSAIARIPTQMAFSGLRSSDEITNKGERQRSWYHFKTTMPSGSVSFQHLLIDGYNYFNPFVEGQAMHATLRVISKDKSNGNICVWWWELVLDFNNGNLEVVLARTFSYMGGSSISENNYWSGNILSEDASLSMAWTNAGTALYLQMYDMNPSHGEIEVYGALESIELIAPVAGGSYSGS